VSAPPGSRGALVRAALVYVGLVFAVGFALGAVRVPILVPRLGERHAELLEMPFMLLAVYLAAGLVVRRFGAAVGARALPGVGGLALALLLGAELIVGVILAGRDLAAYLADRDPVSGAVYLLMLGVFAAMPWLRRGIAADRDTR
jgi:hypothetical protein